MTSDASRAEGDAFDVAVVGGGPAGAAVARHLAAAGCTVALLERTRYDEPRVGETLSAAVLPLLGLLGAEAVLDAGAALPFEQTISAWEDAEPTVHRHDGPGGAHVDRRAFDAGLADAAVRAGADVRLGWCVTRLEERPSGWVVESGHHPALRARVVVDATGRRTHVGHLLGARSETFDRQVAVAARLPAPAEPAVQAGSLVLETVPEGWWYSAPVPGGQVVTALFTDVDVCRDLDLAHRPSWMRALGAAALTGARSRAPRPPARLSVHPATSARLVHGRDPRRWLAIGDAALRIDPLSGTGVARALASAARATEAVLGLLDGDPDPARRFEDETDADCTRHLEARAEVYARYRRFTSAFWTRRHLVPRP